MGKRLINPDGLEELAQDLSNSAFITKLFAEKLASQSVPEALEERIIFDLFKAALNRTHSLLRETIPTTFSGNALIPAFKALSEQVQQTFGLNCTFRCDQAISLPDDEVGMQLYRLVEDAVVMAVKSSRKQALSINIEAAGDQAVFRFTSDAIAMEGARELEIMRYRTRKMGVDLEIRDEGSGVATLIASIPMPKKTADVIHLSEGQRRKAIKILLIDDKPVSRRGLADLIGGEDDLVVCGEIGARRDFNETVAASRPDLVIFDIAFENLSGLGVIRDIVTYFPTLPILIYSNLDEALYAERVLRAGAKGYVMKTETPLALLKAIRTTAAGDIHVSAKIGALVFKKYTHGASALDKHDLEDLSDREFEVFHFIGLGFATQQIAAKMHVSVKTIEAFRARIKKKLKLKSGTELLRRAIQWSLIQG